MAVRPDTPSSVKVVQVIETVAMRGRGDDERDPVRSVKQYWTFDGVLLAEKDPCAEMITHLASKAEAAPPPSR
jgi:hypothetical protein